MVLTFTGSLSAVEADRAEVRTMLIGALGCNFAWGIIDGLLYLMGCLSEQGKGLRALRALREAVSPEQAQHAIGGALPPLVAGVLSPAEYESVRRKLLELPEPPSRPRLGKDELGGALGVFLWVFTATFPVAIPFLFVDEVGLALRLSNAVAIVLLFITGYAYGRVAEYRPWLTGLAMVVIGSVLVGLTIALGG
jgi:VIT1/CCC1 family predicted Fe2+/Mn2+ transporter